MIKKGGKKRNEINKIQRWLLGGFAQNATTFNKQYNCRHEFKKYGFGYLCEKCDLYTGMCEEINKFIKKQRKRK